MKSFFGIYFDLHTTKFINIPFIITENKEPNIFVNIVTQLIIYMDNNFSAQVKEIISFSREEALRLGNDFIGTEHLLLGLIREGDNTAVRILKSFNVDLYELRKEVELAVKDKTGKNIANINSLPLTKQAEKVIRVTVLEAKALKSPTVETEHLMLSILKNKENIATQILNQFDVDYDLFRNELGVVKSNDVRSEYADENEDDFDDEKKYSQIGRASCRERV